MSNRIELKRDTIFWINVIFFLWLFPPVSIMLLFTKQGQFGIIDEIKLLFLSKTYEDGTKKELKLRNLIMKWEILIMTISTIAAIVIIKISISVQTAFNQPYIDKLLQNSTIVVKYVDGKYKRQDNISLTFQLKDGQLIYVDDNRMLYSFLWQGISINFFGTALQNKEYNDQIVFNNLSQYSYRKLGFNFISPDYINRNVRTNAHYVSHFIFDIKLLPENNNSFLGFWSYIPDLYKKNLPHINDDGSIYAEIIEGIYKNENNSNNEKSNNKKSDLNNICNYVGKVYISPNVFSGEIQNNNSSTINIDTLSQQYKTTDTNNQVRIDSLKQSNDDLSDQTNLDDSKK